MAAYAAGNAGLVGLVQVVAAELDRFKGTHGPKAPCSCVGHPEPVDLPVSLLDCRPGDAVRDLFLAIRSEIAILQPGAIEGLPEDILRMLGQMTPN
jgi:hypothetical protein